MTFGDALERMKAGERCKRMGWTECAEMYVEYTSDMAPYLVLRAAQHEPIPYTSTNADVFADDWKVIA